VSEVQQVATHYMVRLHSWYTQSLSWLS